MALQRANLILGAIALLGVAQFVYCVAAAIDAYPGGYSITENYLSDLGRAKVGGAVNSPSSELFNQSIIRLGLAIFPFLLVMPSVLSEGEWEVRFAGCFSAAGLICIGLTPCDVHWLGHGISVGLWLMPTLIMVTAFTGSTKSNGLDRLFAVTLTAVMIAILFTAAGFAYSGGPISRIVFQKVLIALIIVWFCVVLFLASFSAAISMVFTRTIVDQQAREYLTSLRRGAPRDRQLR